MTEKQLQEIVRRIRASHDLSQLTKWQEVMSELQRLLSVQYDLDVHDLRRFLNSSSLFSAEDLDDEVKSFSVTKMQEQVTFIEVAIGTQRKQVTGEKLCALIEDKGYKVEHEWQSDGCHVAVSNPGVFRQVVIFASEVFADWPPQQVMSLLEHNQWQLVIGNTKGKKILYFTNRGFQ